MKFRALISEGLECLKISPDPLDLSLAQEWFKANDKPGRIFTVEIKKWYKKRTLNQNGWFHKIIGVIAIHENVQMKESQVKSGVKWSAADTHGYPKVLNEISGRREPLPSAMADTVQMGILIDCCFEIAGEYHVDTVAQLYREYLEWKEDQRKNNEK